MSRESSSKWSLVALILLPLLCCVLCLLDHLRSRTFDSLRHADLRRRDPSEIVQPLAELEWPDYVEDIEQVLNMGAMRGDTEALISRSSYYSKEADIDFLFSESATWLEVISDAEPYSSVLVVIEVYESDEEAKASADELAAGKIKGYMYSMWKLKGTFQFERGSFADGQYWVSDTLASSPWIDPRYYSVILVQKRNVLISIIEENVLKYNPHRAEVIAVVVEELSQRKQ